MTTTASDQLLEALGLPLDTDVIEWHTLQPVDAAPEPVYVGVTTVDGPTTSVALPAGTVEGDLLVLVNSNWDGASVSDARMELLHTFPGHFVTLGAVWVGRATASTAPLAVSFAGSAGRCSTVLVALHDAELVETVTLSDTSPAAATGSAPLVSSAGFALSIALSRTESFTTGTIVRSGGYTTAGLVNGGSKTAAAISYWDAPGDPATSPADDYAFTGSIDAWGLATLKIAGPGSTSSGPPPEEWARHDARTTALASYTAKHGRPTPLENTSPLQASVQLARTLQGAELPTVGERFRLTINPDVAAALGLAEEHRPRFTGTITDINVVPGRHDPDRQITVLEVTGVGRGARLGSTPLVKLNRPAELDGARVRRILYAAAIVLGIEIGQIDAGTVQLLPLAAVNQSAKALIDNVTADSLGQLVEQRSGRLDWHDAEHRRGRASLVTLAGDQHLIMPFKWTQALGTVVNIAQVSYGDPRKVVTIRDPQSVNALGPYGVQLDTQLEDAGDASSLASTIVSRYADPAWMLPDVNIDIVRTAGPLAAAVLALSHGDKITATGLPPDGAFEAGDLFVEGTTETFTRTAWRLSLAVADPAIAGVGLRWIDVDPALRWIDVEPDVRWLDAAVLAADAIGTPVVDGGTATSAVTQVIDGGTATSTDTDTLDAGAAA